MVTHLQKLHFWCYKYQWYECVRLFLKSLLCYSFTVEKHTMIFCAFSCTRQMITERKANTFNQAELKTPRNFKWWQRTGYLLLASTWPLFNYPSVAVRAGWLITVYSVSFHRILQITCCSYRQLCALHHLSVWWCTVEASLTVFCWGFFFLVTWIYSYYYTADYPLNTHIRQEMNIPILMNDWG